MHDAYDRKCLVIFIPPGQDASLLEGSWLNASEDLPSGRAGCRTVHPCLDRRTWLALRWSKGEIRKESKLAFHTDAVAVHSKLCWIRKSNLWTLHELMSSCASHDLKISLKQSCGWHVWSFYHWAVCTCKWSLGLEKQWLMCMKDCKALQKSKTFCSEKGGGRGRGVVRAW